MKKSRLYFISVCAGILLITIGAVAQYYFIGSETPLDRGIGAVVTVIVSAVGVLLILLPVDNLLQTIKAQEQKIELLQKN